MAESTFYSSSKQSENKISKKTTNLDKYSLRYKDGKFCKRRFGLSSGCDCKRCEQGEKSIKPLSKQVKFESEEYISDFVEVKKSDSKGSVLSDQTNIESVVSEALLKHVTRYQGGNTQSQAYRIDKKINKKRYETFERSCCCSSSDSTSDTQSSDATEDDNDDSPKVMEDSDNSNEDELYRQMKEAARKKPSAKDVHKEEAKRRRARRKHGQHLHTEVEMSMSIDPMMHPQVVTDSSLSDESEPYTKN